MLDEASHVLAGGLPYPIIFYAGERIGWSAPLPSQ